MAIDDAEIRNSLREAADRGEGSWLVGVTLVMRGGEEIHGNVQRVGDDFVVMSTDVGQSRARIASIENIHWHLESQGPE